MPNGSFGSRSEDRRGEAAIRMPALVWMMLLAGAVLFTTVPAIDHWASGLFYVEGRGFPADGSPAWQRVRDLVLWPGYAILVAMVVSLIHRALRGRYLFGLDRKTILYLLGVAAIGIGLIANALLKENWGRARPRQTIEYGGISEYTPPLLIADQCERNCSFVAGEGAYGFFFLAFGLLASPGRRRQVFAAAIAFGSFVGLLRVAMGGHYLSDVYFAALVMLGVAWGLHWLIVVCDITAPAARLLSRRPRRSSG